MNFISCYQLQDNRVSEELRSHIQVPLPITHDLLAVLVHLYSHSTCVVPKPGELEIVDPFDWCCEESYRVRVENEKQLQLNYVGLSDRMCSCDLQHITCSWVVSVANIREDLAVFQCGVCVVWSNISCISQSCVKGHLFLC